MRFVIQRVQHAEVKVDGEVTGSIRQRIPGADRCG